MVGLEPVCWSISAPPGGPSVAGVPEGAFNTRGVPVTVDDGGNISFPVAAPYLALLQAVLLLRHAYSSGVVFSLVF